MMVRELGGGGVPTAMALGPFRGESKREERERVERMKG
jgi:hypothetical protein